MIKRYMSKLQNKIILLVCLVVTFSVFTTNMLIIYGVKKSTEERIGDKAVSIAKIVAKMPSIIDALTGREPEENIQMITKEISESAGLSYVVVSDANGIRKSHPLESRIGERYFGDDGDAAYSGKIYYSVGLGTLGYSLRGFCPIYAEDGNLVGVVGVGILLNDVREEIRQNSIVVFFASIVELIIGLTGAILIDQNVRKATFGFEPSEIAMMFEERNAMLQSVNEGIMAVNQDGIITLLNEEALRILKNAGINENFVDATLSSIIPDLHLLDVLKSRKASINVEEEINGLSIISHCLPISIKGQPAGAIATFREKTEIWESAEEMTGVKNYIEALRAQTHEFMNKLHVILGLVYMGSREELVNYIHSFANAQKIEVDFVGGRIKDPLIAGFIFGKQSAARENGIELELNENSFLPSLSNQQVAHELVTILGNLIDNTMDAVMNSPEKKVGISIVYSGGVITAKVWDTGIGIVPEWKDIIYKRGFSTKKGKRGQGLALVAQSISRISGSIDYASKDGGGTCFSVVIPYE